MKDQDSFVLWQRLSRGDQMAMKEIFTLYFDDVYRSIFRFVKQREACEDLAQEVFLKLWRKRETIQIKQTLKGYITTMAYHEAMGHLRKSSPVQTAEDLSHHAGGYDGNQDVAKLELEEKIVQALNGLPPRCKSIFVLSRYEGKSYREIGQIMDISVKTVENQMSKALKTLRVDLHEYLNVLLMWLIISFLC
ncbi:MAG: RNA polymerase sigma-70 factor [Saprospiraceae bacterium]|nr:RNA polymerase sigma-70 factor [Saprospiraceae bacterium]